MTDTFDLLVVGAGMAGIAAANKCGAAGWRVGIVDTLPYGGTCALRGCDPKKILRRAAEVIDAAHLMRGKGVDPGTLAVNWADLMAHKHGFTDSVPSGMERQLSRNGVVTLHGTARFLDTTGLDIEGTRYEAEHFLIASGARPRPLGFPGSEHLIDSTAFLDLPDLPPRIVFVGGGFVSFEFAHIAARAGAHPMIIDRGLRPLREFDPDLVELLITRSGQAGIEVRGSTDIIAVTRTTSGYQVTLDHNGSTTTIEADVLVHGAGRVPELEPLGLDAAGIASGANGVTVAAHLQSTTNPRVYAAGDAADTPGKRLTPVALFEGKVAASNLLKSSTTVPDYAGVPTTVFTIPELNRVGLLEHEAREAGYDLDIRYTDTSNWYSNYRIGETTGAAKILIDKRTDQVLGAHLLGHGYAELINTLGVAIKLGLTTRQLRSTTATYPSLGSDLGSML